MASHSIRSPKKGVLHVTPINSMPYVDPFASPGSYNSFDPEVDDTEPLKTATPALLYLPSEPTAEQWKNILNASSNGVALTGSAALGAIGPVIGKMDIGENEDSYMFRVAVPGAAREDFTCDVTPHGEILIKGVTTTGEKTVYKNSMKFEMISQNLCPPGHFSISFKLSGPVDPKQFCAHFGIDGVFEGVVKKAAS